MTKITIFKKIFIITYIYYNFNMNMNQNIQSKFMNFKLMAKYYEIESKH